MEASTRDYSNVSPIGAGMAPRHKQQVRLIGTVVDVTEARELASDGRQEDYVAALEALYGIQVEQPQAAPAAECPVDHQQLRSESA